MPFPFNDHDVTASGYDPSWLHRLYGNRTQPKENLLNPAQLFLAQRMRTAESNFSAAAARAERIDDLAELMRTAQVTVPIELRGVIRGMPGYRRLKSVITRRAHDLVQKDLNALKAMKPTEGQSSEDFVADVRRAFGKLQHERWLPLRGNEPSVLTNACREAEAIIATHMRASS